MGALVHLIRSAAAWARRHRALSAAGVGLAAAAALLTSGPMLRAERAAVPAPLPYYEIESVSNGYTASLLNLPLGQPGAFQAPVPVDIDGDLLPDVTVAVNLINAEGILQNPPDVGDVIAPNVEINRLITAPILGQAAKPLKINVKLTVEDLGGGPPTVVRFGYDTGLGGSIPTNFKAVLGGLQDFFNPLTAVVDTTGGYVGLDPNLPDLGLGPVSGSYEGPLTLIGGVETSGLDADVALGYSPFPDAVEITYGTDDAGGQHLTYAHGTFDEVDLVTDLTLQSGGTTTDVEARVDRLPRRMALDLVNTDDGRGSVLYQADSDGRAPDVGVKVAVDTPGEAPLRADVDIEALPRRMSAEWAAPQDGPITATFDASGQGIGAVEARVATFEGDPTEFTQFVPSRRQYLNAQGGIGGGPFDELLISARLERIRHAELVQADDGGFAATVDVGDGAQPLETNLDLDLRADGLPKIDALATIAPMPRHLGLVLDPEGEDQATDPLRVVYDTRNRDAQGEPIDGTGQPVDIDLRADLVFPEAEAGAGCGDIGTVCATLEARNVPPYLEAEVADLGAETRLAVDNQPRPDGAQPDLRATVVLGSPDATNPFLAAPIEASAELQGLPPSVRLRAVQNADDNLEKLEFFACDRDYDANGGAGACSAATAGDEIGAVQFSARNFTEAERPADLPPASPLTPLYATATARGLDDTTDLVRFEATGRFTDIARIQYTNVDDVFGVSTDVGGGKDFSALVDVRNVDLPGDDGTDDDAGRTDIVGSVLLNPLPRTIDLCVGNAGRALVTTPQNATTAPCESADPFGDGTAAVSPLALALRASSSLNVDADVRMDSEYDPDVAADDTSMGAQAKLTNVPADLTALVESPAEGAEGPLRLLALAPGATGFDGDIAVQFTKGGADCDDPTAAGGDVSCIDASIKGIPSSLSAYADTSVPGSANVQFYACDFDFAGTEACRPGTEGEIGSVTAQARIKTGSPDELPVRQPTLGQNIVMVADQENDPDDPTPDRDLQAQVAVKQVRALSIVQTPGGFDGRTDLGDNVTPLEALAYLDLRNDADTEGVLVDASATISPLPQKMAFSQRGPGAEPATDPLVFTYDSSAAVDVVADGKVFPAQAGDECGDLLTACAHVEIDDIPEHVSAVVAKVNGALVGDTRPTDLSIDLALIPDDPTDPKVDVRANGVLGPDLETPLSPPLYFDAELVGAPRYTSVRMEAQETLVPGPDGLEVDSAALERLRINACQLDGDGACVPGTEGEVDSLTANVRSFDLRPTDFPPPPSFAAPLYASISQRPGGQMEAVARITDVSEVQYLNRDGLTGVRSVAGGNKDLAVRVDIEGLPMADPGGSVQLGDLQIDEPLLDLAADVTVTPLPGELDVCFRQGGITPVPAPTGLAFTQPCENQLPFGNDVPLDHTPMSVAYRANTGFDTSLTVDAAITGIDHETGDPAPDHRFRAAIGATGLPNALDVNVLSPIEREVATPDGVELESQGPLRALIDAPGVVGAGPTITFAGAYLIGEDVVCKDARTSVTATCISGKLVNLPTRTEIFYDPTVDPYAPGGNDNLIVTTGGTGTTDFEDLSISSVKPARDEDGALTGKADVLVVDASLTGLPKPLEIRGKLDLPEEPEDPPAVEFLVQDGKSIPAVEAVVQNFIAPDPTLGIAVPDRPVGQGGGAPDQQIVFLQRGDAFKLDAQIADLRGAGFRTTRATTGESMGTQVASLDFGDDQDVRAFIDLQSDATSRVLADVLIEDMAAGVDVCFRSAYTEDQDALTPADPALYCDSAAVASEEGAFELSSTPVGLGQMDVDAFIRLLSGGGTTILSARTDIENIPEVVRGRFPSKGGDTEIATFRRVGNALVPDGIDQIVFQAASFDLANADTGYSGTLPYQPRPQPGGVFPAKAPPASGNQYLHAAFKGSDFQARGQIGKLVGPSSQLKRVLLSPKPCAAPSPAPPDYPHFPADNGVSDYTCIRADFDSAQEDPLDLDVVVADGADLLRLRDAGITDVPAFLQATLATTETWLNPELERGWRRPCGTAAAEPDGAEDCMPPLLRVDQPEADSELFGVLETGRETDLITLDGINPALQLADLNALPATGWGDWGSDPEGVRAKVVSFGSATPENPDDDRTAVRAGIRLDIPRSLTLDQIQTYSSDQLQKGTIPNSSPPESGPLSGKKASDLRLRYAVRDGSGNAVNSIGELTGLVHDFDKNEQILISAPCATSITAGDKTDRPATCEGFARGLSIPGELGVQLYTREAAATVQVDGKNTLRDSLFVQVDGRTSAPLNAGIRMVPGGGPGTGDGIGLLEASVRGTPTGTTGSGTNPLEPSFRLRAEILKDKGIEPPGAVTFFPAISETDVKVNSVFADFNFSPNDAVPARRVEAVIHLNGETKVGADVKGFSTVAGSDPATFSADAGVDIDPLNLRLESRLSFNFSVTDILKEELNDLGFFGDVVAEIVGGLADAVLSGLEAVVNSFPLVIDLKAGLLAQFQIDDLSAFTLRLNLLHAKAITTGPGSATIGNINLDTREFRSGFVFKGSIPIPFPLDIITGGDIGIEIPLLTIDYLPGLIPGLPALEEALGLNTLIDFRNCSSLDVINPFPLTNVNTLEIDGGTTESFVLYPLSDPRFQLSGIFSVFLGGPAGDLFLDAIAGPIFCLAFDPDGANLIGLGSGHPGNAATAIDAFPNHPVPGQGGAPDILPEQVEPSNDPLPPPVPQPPPPGPPAPLPVPEPPGPKFSGPNTTIAAPVSLCGTHTFSALTVDAAVTVASAPVAGNPFGSGTACPAGQEGKLTLQANNLIVNASGSVAADGIVTTNPFNVTPPAVASGTSGGGHGGDGGDGTTPAGGEAYGNDTEEPSTFEGSPGAGPNAGAGGGVIRLVGDDSVIVRGTLSANGTAGGDNGAPGVCDADPDDNGIPGAQTYDHDNDPDTPEIPLPTADPPYEHGGPAGSGGGAGGGIVITGTRVDLAGATVRARGGNGGPGLTGAGGGGGGGVVKVVAPIQTGVAPDVTAGLPGDASALCAGVPAPTPAGDGLAVRVQQPFSKVLPFGQFWYPAGAGAPSSSFDAYVDAAAQGANTDGVTVVRCAVTLPVAAGPPNPGTLQPLFTLPTNQPTVSAPCGSGGATPVQLGATRIFDDEFAPPDPDAEVSITPPATNQYLGVYSVALRPSTAGNDCLLAGDAGGVNDATDCFVERLPAAVDAVVGIDATRPTITIDAPANGLATQSTTVSLELTSADQANLSGVRYLECRTTPDTAFTPCNPTTAAFQLKAEGANTINVRAYDKAGNVSLVDSVTVTVDRVAPTATATISAPDGTNGWHRTPPSITISGHSEAGSAAAVPYVYRFDNGSERDCASLTCGVPASTIDELLPGAHTFSFTAVDTAGNRLFDDDDPATESPMQRPFPGQEADFKFDPDPPQVALALVPATEDQSIGADPWFDTRPFVVAGAIDQVGASGINQVTYDFGDGRGPRTVDDVRIDLADGNGYRLVDPFAAPRLPDGVRTVCARAVDAAGNTATQCRVVRVDSTAPASTILVDGSATVTPTGANGWFTTTPVVTFAGYDDGTGVGTPANRFRYRVDNSAYRLCDPVCEVPGPELGTGEHLVHLAGRDRFDNVAGEETVALKVDLEAPSTLVLVTPDPEAGANDWQLKRPYVRLVGIDQPEGSGIDRITYTLDGGAPQTYTEPFRIERGTHLLCVNARDVAGNEEGRDACRTIQVDLDQPTVTVGQPGPDGQGGWYVSPTAITLTAADAPDDAGVDQTFDPDLLDLCSHLPNEEDPLAPSGTCLSVDGRPFTPYLGGPVSIREGVHTVRAYAVDVAGRRGPITTEVIRVDLSAPVPTDRFVPPSPARGPWYRTVPKAYLAAIDGDQNAGVTSVERRLGAQPFSAYTGPFSIGEGITVLEYRATDAAGLVRDVVRADPVKVDLTPPVVKATAPSPTVLVQIKLLNNLWGLLGPQSAQLGWEINENLSGTVKVGIIIQDLTGNVVRRLDGGTVNVTPGVTKVGSTTWDGKDQTLLQLVPVGLYYYRVVATDEAGNVAQSGESKPIQLRLAVCLPLVGCL